MNNDVSNDGNFGYLHIKILFDQNGLPVDLIFLEVNYYYLSRMQIKNRDIIQKKMTEIIELTDHDHKNLRLFGEISQTRKPAHKYLYSSLLGGWFSVYLFSEEVNHCKIIFHNIPEDMMNMNATGRRNWEMIEMFNKISVSIISFNINGSIIHLNNYFCNSFGYDQKDCASLTLKRILYSEDYQDYLNSINKLKKEGGNVNIKCRIVKKDGSIASVRMNFVILNFLDYLNEYIVSIVDDLSGALFTDDKRKALFEKMVKVYLDLNEFFHMEKNDMSSGDGKEFQFELNMTEKRIIQQVRKGSNNFEIANALCLTESTIKKHLSCIYRKLKVENRVQLINIINTYTGFFQFSFLFILFFKHIIVY